jgi:hypothetical protein
MSKNHLKNKARHVLASKRAMRQARREHLLASLAVVLLIGIALILLFSMTTSCIITGGGGGQSATQTAQAGAPTATFGAEQFHAQQTAWAEPEE